MAKINEYFSEKEIELMISLTPQYANIVKLIMANRIEIRKLMKMIEGES